MVASLTCPICGGGLRLPSRPPRGEAVLCASCGEFSIADPSTGRLRRLSDDERLRLVFNPLLPHVVRSWRAAAGVRAR